MVFFDELFTAVDVGLKRILQDLVIAAAARDNFSALFVTHDLAEAVRVAHRLVVLSGNAEGLVTDRRIDGTPARAATARYSTSSRPGRASRPFRNCSTGRGRVHREGAGDTAGESVTASPLLVEGLQAVLPSSPLSTPCCCRWSGSGCSPLRCRSRMPFLISQWHAHEMIFGTCGAALAWLPTSAVRGMDRHTVPRRGSVASASSCSCGYPAESSASSDWGGAYHRQQPLLTSHSSVSCSGTCSAALGLSAAARGTRPFAVWVGLVLGWWNYPSVAAG